MVTVFMRLSAFLFFVFFGGGVCRTCTAAAETVPWVIVCIQHIFVKMRETFSVADDSDVAK